MFIFFFKGTANILFWLIQGRRSHASTHKLPNSPTDGFGNEVLPTPSSQCWPGPPLHPLLPPFPLPIGPIQNKLVLENMLSCVLLALGQNSVLPRP